MCIYLSIYLYLYLSKLVSLFITLSISLLPLSLSLPLVLSIYSRKIKKTVKHFAKDTIHFKGQKTKLRPNFKTCVATELKFSLHFLFFIAWRKREQGEGGREMEGRGKETSARERSGWGGGARGAVEGRKEGGRDRGRGWKGKNKTRVQGIHYTSNLTFFNHYSLLVQDKRRARKISPKRQISRSTRKLHIVTTYSGPALQRQPAKRVIITRNVDAVQNITRFRVSHTFFTCIVYYHHALCRKIKHLHTHSLLYQFLVAHRSKSYRPLLLLHPFVKTGHLFCFPCSSHLSQVSLH